MRNFLPGRLLAAFASVCLVSLASGQSKATNPWRDVNETEMLARLTPERAATAKRDIVPQLYRTVQLDLAGMKDRLLLAPPEGVAPIEQAGIEVVLPLPYGGFQRFLVVDSPIMEPGLAEKYPEFKTYLAQGVDDPTATARIDVTLRGFRAMVLSARGQYYIDPYWRDETATYVTYYKRNYGPAKSPWTCSFEGVPFDAKKLAEAVGKLPPRTPNVTGTSLRVFRAAIAATGEYTAAVSGTTPGTVPQALSAIITTLNRVSAVYERELATRVVLIANTDAVIYTNAATDPYSDGDGTPSNLLSQNKTTLSTVIGNANYDIGHVFSTNGGGVANFGVCNNTSNLKAGGVTGIPNPIQDPYDIDYVAHEMGHQFGANHPFNGNISNCAGGNRNASTAYEPGSGTTIMAYAGICTGQDLAQHSDDYFHAISRQEIENFFGTTATCSTQSATGNSVPVIAALTNYTIPSQTPFALTASATDANGDNLTYCWEEFDLGAAQDPTANPRDNGASPIFRSFDPTPSPTRLFPSLTYILNNANVPPAILTTTPITIASGEFLPTTSRTMTFRVTVRDNRVGGGAADFKSMTVTSVAAAGPFAITSQNTAATIAAGSSQTVTWNVAGTTANGINTANVNVLLSTDGGLTFPITLAANTPNNGSANVTIPNVAQVATTQGRIKVEAVGNIFFDISDANLTITSSNAAPTVSIASGITVARGSAAATVAVVGTAADANGNPVTVALSDVPGDVAASASIDGSGNISITAQAACSIVTTYTTRTYPMTLTATDSLGSTVSTTVNLIVTPNPSPTVGTYANVVVPQNTVATVTPSAGPADANGNLLASPMTVTPTTLAGGGTISVNQTTGAITVTTTAGTTIGNTTVKVQVQDGCGAIQLRQFTVTVPTATVQLAASATAPGAPSAESCLPPNGAIDPGETVTVAFPVANNGGASTTAAFTATLQASGGVTPIGGATKTYGVLSGGSTGTQNFTFAANGTCGGTITATLALQDGATSYGNIVYTLPLGAPQVVTSLLENFDGVTAPALPAGWTSNVVSGSMLAFRTVSSVNSNSAPNSVFTNTVTSASEVNLNSPQVLIPAAGRTQLQFLHRFLLQTNNDGGVLEIGIEPSFTFTDIVTAGGSFASGGYNTTIASASNVLNTRPAWSGSLNSAYTTTLVNLPAAAAGKNVIFRWRLATNTGTSPTGAIWRIDTISTVTTTANCTSCSSAPEYVSALPASPLTVGTPYSHQFTATGSPTPTYSLRSGTLPPGITLTSGGLLSGTPTSAGAGAFNGLMVRAENTAGSADQSFDLAVRTLAANYLAGFGLSGGNAAVTADPNGDGVPNLLAYALGLDPTAPVVQLLPTAAIKNYAGVPYVYLTFNRSSVATDLTYVVQSSPDLQTWTTIATSSGGAVTSGAGFVGETGTAPTFNVEVRDTQPVDPITGARRFLRLQVSTP